jgi:hypothetical protein
MLAAGARLFVKPADLRPLPMLGRALDRELLIAALNAKAGAPAFLNCPLLEVHRQFAISDLARSGDGRLQIGEGVDS